jgi:transposase InsO family protein
VVRVGQLLLAARAIVCSMGRRGNCWDNAVMESFFSTVKSELGESDQAHLGDHVSYGAR